MCHSADLTMTQPAGPVNNTAGAPPWAGSTFSHDALLAAVQRELLLLHTGHTRVYVLQCMAVAPASLPILLL
jgi:hypothetical protein